MNCNIDYHKSYDTPAFAGNLRFLFGLTLSLIGLYLATLSNVRGHGLGWLLILIAPFVIFKDDK